jgi:hypothetical protein
MGAWPDYGGEYVENEIYSAADVDPARAGEFERRGSGWVYVGKSGGRAGDPPSHATGERYHGPGWSDDPWQALPSAQEEERAGGGGGLWGWLVGSGQGKEERHERTRERSERPSERRNPPERYSGGAISHYGGSEALPRGWDPAELERAALAESERLLKRFQALPSGVQAALLVRFVPEEVIASFERGGDGCLWWLLAVFVVIGLLLLASGGGLVMLAGGG